MLVLGDRYAFIPLELDLLKKRYNLEPVSITDITIDAIKRELDKHNHSIIILNTDKEPSKDIVAYLTTLELEGIQFYTIEHFLEKYLQKVYIPKKVKYLNFLDEIRPYSKTIYLAKRAIDYILGLFLIIISTPIMIYAAYRIKKESPEGPIIYKQKRVGLHSKEFICYKFRSMVPNAENDKPKFASEEDPRIFKWGAFMRKTRIDELPQLWNVLKGDMHLIGPRPERRYWVEKFQKNIPYYNIRHLVKPGITGWAQVNYHYGSSEEDAYQKLMYDLFYIKNWSLGLELKTILKTIGTILAKKGA